MQDIWVGDDGDMLKLALSRHLIAHGGDLVSPRTAAAPPGTEDIAVPADGKLMYMTDGDGLPGFSCKVPATWGAVNR